MVEKFFIGRVVFVTSLPEMKMKEVRISCRESGASALGRWWTSLAKSKSNPGCGEPRRYAGSASQLLHNVRQAAADPDSL